MRSDEPEVYKYDVGGLGQVVTFANVLITIVLISGIYFDNKSATMAVVAGVLYFAFSTGLTLLALSRTLTDVITNRQEQITVRELQRLQYYAQQAVQVVDHAQPPRRLSAAPPLALPSFVPPYAELDDGARREAAAWVLQLYAADGQPDPKKVLLNTDRERPGRVRVASPSRAAKEYLVASGVLHDLGNGYRLALSRYPTIVAARDHLQGHGVARLPTQGGGLPTTPQRGE